MFANDIQPITLIMLLDRSGSMKPNFDLEERAAEAFVGAMLPKLRRASAALRPASRWTRPTSRRIATPEKLDGKMHDLTLHLSAPDLMARARKRYLASKLPGGS